MLELISVLMSAYNESELELKSSIYSILNQTHDRIELILVNDNPENKIIKFNYDEYGEKEKPWPKDVVF